MVVPLSTDLASIAGLYSTLAGVLAGFAFSGLIALIAAQVQAGPQMQESFQSVVPLTSAFLGLVGASLNYAIIAGEGSKIYRASVLESVGGLGFAAAGIMLFYSVLVLLNGVNKDFPSTSTVGNQLRSVTNFLRGVIIIGVSPALVVLMEGGIRDQEVRRFGLRSTAGHLFLSDYVSFALALTLLLAGIVVFVIFKARSASGVAPGTPASAPSGVPLFISVLTVFMTVASVIATTIVSLYVSESYAGGIVEWIFIQIAMSGYLVCILVATYRTQ